MNRDVHLGAVSPHGSVQDLPARMPDGIKKIVPALHGRPIHGENQIPTLQSSTAGGHPLFHRTHKRCDGEVTERTLSILYVRSFYFDGSLLALPVDLEA